MHLRELFNKAKENREARRELAAFLRTKARTDDEIGLLDKWHIKMAASSPMILNHLLGKIADWADERALGEITPDQFIDFLKRFFEEIWPLLFEAIKAVIAMF